jgi:phytoene synthase
VAHADIVHARDEHAVDLRVLREVPALRELAEPYAYLGRHSRSFRFAAALLRGADRERVARVYAWCRFTDDLVDTPGVSAHDMSQRLDAWLACSRLAYQGRPCGVPLVDRVMGDMAERGIPFAYAEDLATGVRSDLTFTPVEDLAALQLYAHRVAGVVGCWLTELHGVRDSWMLDRASALGAAMQVTNILRDVGEDWDRGRVYLPLTLLHRHGLVPHDIGAMRRGMRPVDESYRRLMEELMAIAEAGYDAGREAMPMLPAHFRHSVAVAAAVYEGIHDVIRRNGYDNVHRRAVTSAGNKVALAASALWGTCVRGSRVAAS